MSARFALLVLAGTVAATAPVSVSAAPPIPFRFSELPPKSFANNSAFCGLATASPFEKKSLTPEDEEQPPCYLADNGVTQACSCRFGGELRLRTVGIEAPASEAKLCSFQLPEVSTAVGAPRIFRVFSGEIGRAGVLGAGLLRYLGSGNGLAPLRFDVLLLPDATRCDRSVRFEADYSAPEIFQRNNGRTYILATQQEDGKDSHGKWGTYFAGRPFVLEGGELVPDFQRPIVRRRFLNSFLKEMWARRSVFRDESGETTEIPEGRPRDWLRPGKVEHFESEPFLGESRSRRLFTGAVMKVGAFPRDAATGAFARVEVTEWGSAQKHSYQLDSASVRLGANGLKGMRRLFPPAYLPPEPQRLEGRRVIVEEYSESGEEADQLRTIVLWLQSDPA